MRNSVRSAFALLGALGCLFDAISSCSASQLINAFIPGRMGPVSARYLGSKELDPAWKLLLTPHGRDAIALFEMAVANNPDDLAAFVGLIQANPPMWPGEIMRLEDEVNKGADDPATRFKLGTLLFYDWAAKKPAERQKSDAQRKRATALLENAWRARKAPIIGLMLCALYEDIGSGTYNRSQIMDQLLRELAGPSAYRVYQRAKREHWQSDPPTAIGVPEANRQPLVSLIDAMTSIARASWGGPARINARVVMVRHDPDEEHENQARFLDRWRVTLIAALTGQGKRF